ncbi:WYL domain-containing protein [Desulfonema limicola]|uniref:WYL domain-containing protein n=1 Tax=Desulfonema limicola TaxID=45656 RepID=A0A975B9F7_9BACT|nr:WYL domain-containing protein [Desulfonema limicola]QTA81107.1 WYL domain-containing protein [Desulfonema limicola]
MTRITCFSEKEISSDYNFGLRHKNAFSAFPGETTEHVKIRFSRQARPFIEESLWHHTQKTTRQENGTLIFEADAAYPREVMWWSFFWGAEAEILEPEWLREEAEEEIRKMGRIYKLQGQPLQ